MTMDTIMEILVGDNSSPNYKSKPVIIQGITGKYGSLHTRLMLDYGTNIVGGVVPGKGGQHVYGLPVFDNTKQAILNTNAEISVIFVPAIHFLDAAMDAIQSGIKLIVAITEHVPIRDTLKALREAEKEDVTIIGPNTPGIIVPKIIKLGIMTGEPFKEGSIALFSRSGTLMYEIAQQLSQNGLGQSLALGVGGDPINCSTLNQCFEWVRDDNKTKAVVIVGEIGGDSEEKLSEYIEATNFSKPVISYISGKHAPKEKKMGHAGAIIYGNYGTWESKWKAFNKIGISVAQKPSQIPNLVKEALNEKVK